MCRAWWMGRVGARTHISQAGHWHTLTHTLRVGACTHISQASHWRAHTHTHTGKGRKGREPTRSQESVCAEEGQRGDSDQRKRCVHVCVWLQALRMEWMGCMMLTWHKVKWIVIFCHCLLTLMSFQNLFLFSYKRKSFFLHTMSVKLKNPKDKN